MELCKLKYHRVGHHNRNMPHSFFDPKGMAQLASVYDRAKSILDAKGVASNPELDMMAARLLRLAADGIHDEDLRLKGALGKWGG